ncbi:MAG: 2,3-bisphosphoglycerate-independent phosphoglycerate mutase [Mycoplasmataceae bacterium]|nr:2,3-bisphosphoglycerate-independent phosphoglycerate mutase [Mycoplasmataceae bacterium]
MKKPIVLTVIDGLGLRKDEQGNAYAQADTPVLDKLLKEYPNSVLGASGNFVGLPEGQIGNSEVGHLNIGAGEIVYTGLSLIQKALDDGTFADNKAFANSIKFANKNNSTIQILGLLSPGGVHSQETHLFALLKGLHERNVKNVTVHAFTDGRDVEPRSVKPSLVKLMKLLEEYGYKLGSIGGRLYGMDRDQNFDKVELAFEAMQGRANKTFDDIFDYVEEQYNVENHNDEFINVAINSDKTTNFFKENDSVIFFNFRPDRAQQLAHLIIGSNKYEYQPKNKVANTQLTVMMKYEGINNAEVAFDSWEVKNTIGSTISNAGLKQLRIAETQKYGHVTFFMDGGIDFEYEGADRILVPSVKVDNFADAPLMSADGITKELIKVLGNYDIVIMNYANPDMVGHTGNLEAAKIAVNCLDTQLGRLKEAIDKLGGTLFITADHGNAEITEDKNGSPATKHTTNDVFLISTDKEVKLKNGALANVTPTILDYMGIEKPKSMTHDSLLEK